MKARKKRITAKNKWVNYLPPLGIRKSSRNNKKNIVKPKSFTLEKYDSPLTVITHNCKKNTPSTSGNLTKQELADEDTDEEITDQVDSKEVVDEVVNEEAKEMGLSDKILEKTTNNVNDDLDDEFSNLTFDFLGFSSNKDSFNDSASDTKVVTRKKKSLLKRLGTGEKIDFSKKNKLKNKSLLSSFKDSSESNKLLESIIFVEDSESEKSKVKSLNKSEQSVISISDLSMIEKAPEISLSNDCIESTNPNCKQPRPQYFKYVKDYLDDMKKNESTCLNTQQCNSNSVTNREDIVVVDCNDSLQMEMNAYHNKFNESTNCVPTCSDSVIILDADDEPPDIETSNISNTELPTLEESSKINEDCLVVWSSIPEITTSTPEPHCKSQPFGRDSDILKQDKILIDTSPNMSNYKFLNNKNNKPKKKFVKSPKFNTKSSKKQQLKSILETTKAMASRTAKSAAEVANKVVSKSPENSKSKISSKRKNKIDEDLIYLAKKDGRTETKKTKKGKLREIVIDGSNVGMACTQSKFFSEQGIKMLIDYFTKRGHSVKVFIPQYRRNYSFPLLEKWYTEGIVVFTPSRKLGNKNFTPYDDRYILEYATACDGIVVSQDQFRDLYSEKPQYRDTIENRLLVPTFVGDYVMFPEDPLGRNGPTLAEFLRH